MGRVGCSIGSGSAGGCALAGSEVPRVHQSRRVFVSGTPTVEVADVLRARNRRAAAGGLFGGRVTVIPVAIRWALIWSMLSTDWTSTVYVPSGLIGEVYEELEPRLPGLTEVIVETPR